MIFSIVKLLLAFPKLGRLFFKIHSEYKKEISTSRLAKHRDLIDDWVRDAETDENTGVPERTAAPRIFRN